MSPDETILERQRTHLIEQLTMRIDEYSHWWRVNNRLKNMWFYGSLACSLGVTIAGTYSQAHLAAVFGAISTVVIAVQKETHYKEEEIWYGGAISTCKVLFNKTKSANATIESLATVEDNLNVLIAQEIQKNQKYSKRETPNSAQE